MLTGELQGLIDIKDQYPQVVLDGRVRVCCPPECCDSLVDVNDLDDVTEVLHSLSK